MFEVIVNTDFIPFEEADYHEHRIRVFKLTIEDMLSKYYLGGFVSKTVLVFEYNVGNQLFTLKEDNKDKFEAIQNQYRRDLREYIQIEG